MVTQTEARRGRADASAGRPPWPESNPPCEEEEEKKGLQRWFSGVVAVVAVGRRWLAGGDRRSPETADRMVAVRVKPNRHPYIGRQAFGGQAARAAPLVAGRLGRMLVWAACLAHLLAGCQAAGLAGPSSVSCLFFYF
jgi:hypothetical protein